MYKAGDIVEGVVSGIQNYGAFVQLDDCIGLVHISEVSNKFVKDIQDYLTLNEKYTFYVIDYDPVANQAKLSYKKIHEESERRTRSTSKNIHLNKNEIFFNDTYNKVLESIGQQKEEIIKLNFNNKLLNKKIEDINIEDFNFIKYPFEMMEKDTLKIRQDSLLVKERNDKLLVISDYLFFDVLDSYIEFNHLDKTNLIYINKDASLSSIKDLLEKLDTFSYSVLFVLKEEYNESIAIMYRLFKKELLNKYENVNDRIYFVFDEKDQDILDLVNKEWYFGMPSKDYLNILSPSYLFVLSYLGLDIYDLAMGYRRAIIDCVNDKMYLNILEKVNSGHVFSYDYDINKYLRFFKDLDMSIDIEYRTNQRLILPKFKDKLKKVKSKEGKYIEDKLDDNYDLNITIFKKDAFTLGYISLLLYLLNYLKSGTI